MIRYEALRDELELLEEKFAEAPSQLNHDLLWGPDETDWEEAEYEAFVAANQESDDVAWERWNLWPKRDACSRFWSSRYIDRHYIRYFTQLACRAYRILVELNNLADEDAPEGLIVDPFALQRYPEEYPCGWLTLIHQWAFRFPTEELQGECGRWKVDQLDVDQFGLAEHVTELSDGSVAYHTHPLCLRLDTDVFSASAGLLRLCLAPETTVHLGIWDGQPEFYFPPTPEAPEPSPQEDPLEHSTHLEEGAVEHAETPSRSNVPQEEEQNVPRRSKPEFDRERFTVSYGESQSCFLGNTISYRLLARLAETPGKFFALHELKTDVWGEDVVEDETVARAVRDLRGKLQKAGVRGIKRDRSQSHHVRLIIE